MRLLSERAKNDAIDFLITGYKGQTFTSSDEALRYLRERLSIFADDIASKVWNKMEKSLLPNGYICEKHVEEATAVIECNDCNIPWSER